MRAPEPLANFITITRSAGELIINDYCLIFILQHSYGHARSGLAASHRWLGRERRPVPTPGWQRGWHGTDATPGGVLHGGGPERGWGPAKPLRCSGERRGEERGGTGGTQPGLPHGPGVSLPSRARVPVSHLLLGGSSLCHGPQRFDQRGERGGLSGCSAGDRAKGTEPGCPGVAIGQLWVPKKAVPPRPPPQLCSVPPTGAPSRDVILVSAIITVSLSVTIVLCGICQWCQRRLVSGPGAGCPRGGGGGTAGWPCPTGGPRVAGLPAGRAPCRAQFVAMPAAAFILLFRKGDN